MRVNIVSPTIQEFNGERFYLCGRYFQHKGKRLHRTVWEHHNGDVPVGYEVHHIDGDTTNNDIENLRMMKNEDHQRYHMSEPERVMKSREDIKKAGQAANVWHGSEDGFKFHSRLAKQYWGNAPMRNYTCTFCGKPFQTRHVYGRSENHFCHQNCRASYRRKRIKEAGNEG